MESRFGDKSAEVTYFDVYITNTAGNDSDISKKGGGDENTKLIG
jgi:hypothetical protein